ncbi:MAG: hypothetical protein BHW57_05195 [Azospirillum sp. 47_25]|nr:MAG: hypothetical protein BHW57_05195 [Azospirillum sp. 47_25]
MLLRKANCDLDVERFKSFYNSWQLKILLDLYHEDLKAKNFNIKADFLSENISKNNEELFLTLQELDNQHQYKRYYEKLIALLMYKNIDEESFQRNLEKINEKSEKRKGNGVYYTPEDVSTFIILNSFALLNNENGKLFNNINSLFTQIDKTIIAKTILDPTCGTGAFLVRAFDAKVELAKKIYGNNISDEVLLLIVKSLYGNDIDMFSTYISQTRILFKVINLSLTINIRKLLNILKENFFNFDFVSSSNKIKKKFDFIIGNPPYVEKSKCQQSSFVRYGNIYADVVDNSLNLLNNNGVLGYIIPLSYVSTSRFSTLRDVIKNNTNVEYLLSFADRPDCLFSGVHQKLNIILAKKQKSDKHDIFTSDYIYWYKNQRKSLFDNLNVSLNSFVNNSYYPKLGNDLEQKIYHKISKGLYNINSLVGSGDKKLYVNMRAAFWIKSFITQPYKSNEYKEFLFDEEKVHLVNIILNSSLFWWLWVKISDCWHLTNKEFSVFSIPDLSNINYSKVITLSKKINEELDKTKEIVNTKQTMYEYKHKRCKHIIDQIDDYLATLYSFSTEETNYIKHYKENYRLGISNDECG